MRRSEPDYVVGSKGSYRIQVPITHPPHCVCEKCRKRRKPNEWATAYTIRILRASRFPDSKVESAAYAREVKRDEESRLREAVERAREERRGVGNSVTVGMLCDAYRAYQRAEGKRIDRDQYRITAIETFFGRDRDALSVDKADYSKWKDELQRNKCSAATIARHTNTLLAVFNHGLKEFPIDEHRLKNLKRPRVRRNEKPVAFTKRQVAVLLGPAMLEYESEQAQHLAAVAATGKDIERRQVSFVPLRGMCLIAYLTLMRPKNNLALRWDDLTLDDDVDRGSFHLREHKNSSKGVRVEAALHPDLVRYLKSLRTTATPTGLIHPNPATGGPYKTIRKQWLRLVEIANSMLPPNEQLVGARQKFYTWRHTGASGLAEISNPVLIVRMMGDTSLTTVMKHYFDSSVEHMAEMLERWNPIREREQFTNVSTSRGKMREHHQPHAGPDVEN